MTVTLKMFLNDNFVLFKLVYWNIKLFQIFISSALRTRRLIIETNTLSLSCCKWLIMLLIMRAKWQTLRQQQTDGRRPKVATFPLFHFPPPIFPPGGAFVCHAFK